MFTYKSDFLKVLEERGMLHQCTDFGALDALMLKEPIVAYIGFDATADSLHVGSLAQIMLLRRLQQCGHKPIVLMGGATTKIGDPSGKDAARKMLDDTQIAYNISRFQELFERYLTFGSGSTDAILLNNDDWLKNLNYLEFLRDYGRHFTINKMLSFDSVKLRLEREQPLTFLEFNYMILQAYDFMELNKQHKCMLQMGGSDQWGNIVNGVDLARRVNRMEVFGLTIPLVTTADGQKMGKSENGAVWLHEDKLSSFYFWQYWRNVQDADVARFLKLFTDLPLSEIERLSALEGAEINEAKKILADEVTRLTHGEDAVQKAREAAESLFENRGNLSDANIPTVEIPGKDLVSGIPAYDLFFRIGLAPSKGEARRLIRGGGGKLNDASISAEDRSVSMDDLNADGVIKVSAGRKKHILVRAI